MNTIISTLSNVQAAASSTFNADGSIAVLVTLSIPDVAQGRQLQIGAQQHYLVPDVARAAVSDPVNEDEALLGLSLVDLITVRALRSLKASGQLQIPDLIPESLRD